MRHSFKVIQIGTPTRMIEKENKAMIRRSEIEESNRHSREFWKLCARVSLPATFIRKCRPALERAKCLKGTAATKSCSPARWNSPKRSWWQAQNEFPVDVPPTTNRTTENHVKEHCTMDVSSLDSQHERAQESRLSTDFLRNVARFPHQMAEMLRFAAFHEARPSVKVLRMDQANLVSPLAA